MYFKVVINTEDSAENGKTPIVRYMEAENVNNLFDLLRKYYGLESGQSAARLRMFRTVDQDEFNGAREMNQGTLH